MLQCVLEECLELAQDIRSVAIVPRSRIVEGCSILLWVCIIISREQFERVATLVSFVLFRVNFIQNATFSTKHRQKGLSASSGIFNLGSVDGWQWCEIQQTSNRLLWKNWWIVTFYIWRIQQNQLFSNRIVSELFSCDSGTVCGKLLRTYCLEQCTLCFIHLACNQRSQVVCCHSHWNYCLVLAEFGKEATRLFRCTGNSFLLEKNVQIKRRSTPNWANHAHQNPGNWKFAPLIFKLRPPALITSPPQRFPLKSVTDSMEPPSQKRWSLTLASLMSPLRNEQKKTRQNSKKWF